jgi:hypothetical protein
MKEIIKLEVSVMINYDDKKSRSLAIREAKRITKSGSVVSGYYRVKPNKSKLLT